MPKGRMPASGGGAEALGSKHVRRLLCASALAVIASVSCQEEKLLQPGSVPSNILTAVYVTDAEFYKPSTQPGSRAIEIDGKAVGREWGGAQEQNRPFTEIRISAEEGAGNPGLTAYVSAKAVYTDNDIYILFRWYDTQADEKKDVWTYVGPDLSRLPTRTCYDLLLSDRLWRTDPVLDDEDRFSIAFQPADSLGARDESGTFRNQGCQVACHVGERPSFGRPGSGHLDVWQWMATRTNQVRNLYTVIGEDERLDLPDSPLRGTPGYLDDLVADPVTGLTPDPGTPPWRRNAVEGRNRPRYIYRILDDELSNPSGSSTCTNLYGEKCRKNNSLPFLYIWREGVAQSPEEFGACDTLNQGLQGEDPRKWRSGDEVGGYYFTYPTGSRADVHGKGGYEEERRSWTLEIGRHLVTRDPLNDVAFDPAKEYVFTIAVADNSGQVHWGSGPQILRFEPKPVTPRKAGAAGVSGGGEAR